ncbi:organic hydroperoxide resistance protein [Pseudonocardia spinosispora]|uniref:organic hydroperoxide resistance protein n=1 Tax=Pseudonocardia spinosispora TaxID=103441 RepID=UPI000414E06F|nr:organic hydroperoxide resistance protein [Pseudonocardia spinosispora]
MADSQYTATVRATGEGRNGGRVASDDGVLDAGLAVPKELGGAGGATNPEQLLAAGWAACFLGAVRRAASERTVRVRELAITAEVTLHHRGDDFSLSAALNVDISDVDQRTADELVAAAHTICPYSKATRDNIPVTLNATVA